MRSGYLILPHIYHTLTQTSCVGQTILEPLTGDLTRLGVKFRYTLYGRIAKYH